MAFPGILILEIMMRKQVPCLVWKEKVILGFLPCNFASNSNSSDEYVPPYLNSKNWINVKWKWRLFKTLVSHSQFTIETRFLYSPTTAADAATATICCCPLAVLLTAVNLTSSSRSLAKFESLSLNLMSSLLRSYNLTKIPPPHFPYSIFYMYVNSFSRYIETRTDALLYVPFW